MKGTIYLVATPIGNLGDITLRALETLKKVDIIAAEDTRHTLQLLNHFSIRKPLVSYHRHNEEIKKEELIAKVKEGKSIAIVTDAGTPRDFGPRGDHCKICYSKSNRSNSYTRGMCFCK